MHFKLIISCLYGNLKQLQAERMNEMSFGANMD